MDYLRWSEAVTPAMSLPSHATGPGEPVARPSRATGLRRHSANPACS